MKLHHRLALLAGAALVVGTGTALSQIVPPPPSPDLYGPGPMHGRLADRALRDFDLNKDRQITKAEVDKALAQRFSATTGGSPTMTEAQFEKAHENTLREHTGMLFHRIDWNGDGVLSLDEYRAPLRDGFARMDRDGAGTISCKPRDQSRSGPGANKANKADTARGHGRRGGHFRGSLAKMCQEADLNKDGKITRAEFDTAVADKYTAAVKGGKGMIPDAFYRVELVRFQDMEARRFKRLDTNNDGKLSEAEFAATARKLFTRLDKNKDGILSKDELAHPRHDHHRGSDKKPR